MKCPYCENEMTNGKIYGDRYLMKWVPDTERLVAGVFVPLEHIKIGRYNGLFKRISVDAAYCSKCNKMIIDLD